MRGIGHASIGSSANRGARNDAAIKTILSGLPSQTSVFRAIGRYLAGRLRRPRTRTRVPVWYNRDAGRIEGVAKQARPREAIDHEVAAGSSWLSWLILATRTGMVRRRGPEPDRRRLARRGDEIVVCGQLYHTTTPVVLWTDPGGYDAYRLERRFVPLDQAQHASPERRRQAAGQPLQPAAKGLTEEEIERVRGGGWDLPLLRKAVDQFVIHFDARGTSRRCFEVLHDLRGLSVHFMLDLDGTIYQTLDVKEAGLARDDRQRPVDRHRDRQHRGLSASNVRARWTGGTSPGQGGPSDRGPRPAGPIRPPRPDCAAPAGARRADRGNDPGPGAPPVRLHRPPVRFAHPPDGDPLHALSPRSAATIRAISPGPSCRPSFPTPSSRRYRGILGHYHVQTNKVDPGPAFQWDRVIEGLVP